MQFLSFLIIVQLLIAGITLNTSLRSKQASVLRHTAKQVLGTSIIADDTLPSPGQTQSSDQSTQSSSDQTQSDASQSTAPSGDVSNNTGKQSTDQQQQPQPTQDNTSGSQSTASIDQNNTNQPSGQNVTPQENSRLQQQLTITPSPSDQSNNIISPQITTYQQNQITQLQNSDQSLLQDVSPTEIPSAQQKINNDQISPVPTLPEPVLDNKSTIGDSMSVNTAMPNTDTSGALSTAANNIVTNPDSVLANPQQVDENTMQKAQQENHVLATSQTPQDKVNTLVSFAKDKVINIETSLKQTDYSTTSFLTQRLNDQLDQTVQALSTVPQGQSNKAKQYLQAFCNKADLALKTEQISVPEDLEQDVIIARGKCLELQQ